MPASIATLTDLLGRVEGGTGADRELWCDLLLALLDPQGEGDKATRRGAILMAEGTIQGDGTESIDAALALVERVLLDGRAVTGILSDALDRIDRTGWRPDLSLGPQLSRAILIELLTALVEGGDHADA